jgi:uroporphyrinogen-III decarboxylase
MEKNWADMTPGEKREQRFQWWSDTEGIKFVNPEAERNYHQRLQRMIAVYKVQEPDRVPVTIPGGSTPAYLDGTDFYTCMYDYDRAIKAWNNFNKEFPDSDSYASPGMILPGKIYDLLDYKLYSYPGHGLPLDATGIQFVEGEYMKAEEYDDFIRNPSDFWQRVYMPRTFGAFKSWTSLQPWTNIIEAPAGNFMPFTKRDVQAAERNLIKIGKELQQWSEVMGKYARTGLEKGYPMARSGLAFAPFDALGDTLRGTKGIIADMFRCPDKLLEAIDVITGLIIENAVTTAKENKSLTMGFPLHKGADGWMSDKQFNTFYWPSLKKVCDALINEGVIPSLFAEGSYETRLESVNVFPKGAVTWMFDRTDMAKAKKILGNKCCISGNVPTSLLITGTPKEVKEYCRHLIEVCGKGGGYILTGGAQVDYGEPSVLKANIHAMLDTVKEYGVYKK